jgi:toxin FitB
MIMLDTNVISEFMRKVPEHKVQDWFGRQRLFELAVSAITVAEIMRGLSRLPAGKRRTMLVESFDGFMEETFKEGVIPFDEAAARVYGPMAASREKAGFNTDTVDLMIAASARSRSASVATRNVRDFEDCGVVIINPWEAE